MPHSPLAVCYSQHHALLPGTGGGNKNALVEHAGFRNRRQHEPLMSEFQNIVGLALPAEVDGHLFAIAAHLPGSALFDTIGDNNEGPVLFEIKDRILVDRHRTLHHGHFIFGWLLNAQGIQDSLGIITPASNKGLPGVLIVRTGGDQQE